MRPAKDGYPERGSTRVMDTSLESSMHYINAVLRLYDSCEVLTSLRTIKHQQQPAPTPSRLRSYRPASRDLIGTANHPHGMASARIFSRFFQRALLRRQLSHRHEDGKGHKRRAQVRRVLLDARKRAWCSRFDDAPGRLMLVADAGRIKVVPVAREGDEKVAIPRCRR